MARKKTTRVVTFLSLAIILFITTGMHLLHPLLHEHLAARERAAVFAGAPSGRPEARQAVQDADGDDDCPVCRFLSTFHANSPSIPPADMQADVILTRFALPASPLSQQLPSFPFAARAPPC